MLAARATKGKPVRVTGAAKNALEMLKRAICESGETPPVSNHIPDNVKAVKFEQWRRYFYLGTGSDTTSLSVSSPNLMAINATRDLDVRFLRASWRSQPFISVGSWSLQ